MAVRKTILWMLLNEMIGLGAARHEIDRAMAVVLALEDFRQEHREEHLGRAPIRASERGEASVKHQRATAVEDPI